MNKNKLSAIALVAALALGLSACGDKAEVEPATQSAEAAAPTETAAEPVDTSSAVETKAVELFRIAVPNDPATDEQIIEEMTLKGSEIVAFMDAGGTSKDFLTQEAAEDPANVVRNQALLTGALAMDPSIAQHQNY